MLNIGPRPNEHKWNKKKKKTCMSTSSVDLIGTVTLFEVYPSSKKGDDVANLRKQPSVEVECIVELQKLSF